MAFERESGTMALGRPEQASLAELSAIGAIRFRLLSSRFSSHRVAAVLFVAALVMGCASSTTPAEPDGDLGQKQAGGVSERGAEAADPLDAEVDALVAAKPGPVPEPTIPADESAGNCDDLPNKRRGRKSGKAKADASKPAIGLMVSPARPVVGDRVRIVSASLATESPWALRLEGPGTQGASLERIVRDGVPAMHVLSFVAEKKGRYQIVIGRDGKALRCDRFRIRPAKRAARRGPGSADPSQVWPNRRRWNAEEEALFSAWVRELFHAPADSDLAWSALHEATSDPQRNLLHDYLGMGEDASEAGLTLKPDCADTPYFLRAYFAWKRRLPFMFHRCSRGAAGAAPSCRVSRTNTDAPDLNPRWLADDDDSDAAQSLKAGENDAGAQPLPEPEPEPEIDANELMVAERFFRRTVAWGVHTGNGRIPHDDEMNDFYPVKLQRSSLRPGVMYADPYGHILVVAEWVAGSNGGPGILFAVDGQPDASITRKRFWEGNFLWNPDPALGGSGFKAFRPVVIEDGQPRMLEYDAIARHSAYGDVASGGIRMDATQFYDEMEALITPGVRNPFAIQAGVVAALAEAVRIRVTSVENGVRWVAENPGQVIEMPTGYSLFETTGAWENYSTPARDLRLLFAIDVVLGFSEKVERNPADFGVEDSKLRERVIRRLAVELERLLADPAFAISYERSDGSKQRLRLSEIIERRKQFEMAYNPNDCPERRWAAPEGSAELATCNRTAPESQRAKMVAYRPWFADRRRPARGDPGPAIE